MITVTLGNLAGSLVIVFLQRVMIVRNGRLAITCVCYGATYNRVFISLHCRQTLCNRKQKQAFLIEQV